MQGIILAAGQSRRMGLGKPKCLAEIGDTTLFGYQLDMFRRFSIRDICVVVGYRREDLIPYIRRAGCSYRVNERFETTNSLFSFSLALDWINDSCLICNSDVLADARIYSRLLRQPGNALAYDSSSGQESEHMKVRLDRFGQLLRMGKDLSCEDFSGENLGLLKIEKGALGELAAATMQELEEDGDDKWIPAAISRLARANVVQGVDVANLPWVEIDFPEDLETARSTVWRQIRAIRPPVISRKAAGQSSL